VNAVNMSFLDFEQGFEKFALAIAVGVLLLVVYEVVILITATLATRTGTDRAASDTADGTIGGAAH
jgi:hypothetical protein